VVNVTSHIRVKCKKCEREAVVRVPYAKLNLCSEHYVEYFERRVLGAINRYKMLRNARRVLVAVSGGKDSLTVLRVLAKYKEILGVELCGLHLDLGINGYSEESKRVVLESCRENNVECYIISLRELIDYTLPEVVEKTKRPPCSVCGLFKRYILNAAALNWGFDVVVTGHHMDDVLVFRLKEMLTGHRESEALKLAPITPGISGIYATRARPLYETYEWEIKLYSEITGLKHVETLCPFKYRDIISSSIAEMLDKVEREAPGFKIALARRLAKKSPRETAIGEITPCQYCSMPSSTGICSMCKLTMRTHGKPMGPYVREKLRNMKTK
jgi:uncharacterized protein (TIGR00269 family)